MAKEEIGCCGAYCGTCPVLRKGLCKGCKLGYGPGERDLSKAKCAMKACCMRRGLVSCADCADYETCAILAAFYGHAGYKYRKYREATAFIRERGYEEYLRFANGWNGAYGKLE